VGIARTAVTMEQRYFRLEQQIERCRRLASMMIDDNMRHSLEQLADEYEAQLPKNSFMLGSKSRQ
jgi:hypothetical protein